MDLTDSRRVPEGWAMRTIADVCERVTSGGTPSRKVPGYYEDGRWPWVKTQELGDGWIDDTEEHITGQAVSDSSAKVLPVNTVLMAMYGATVGKLGILRAPMTCNQACCAMVVDPDEADHRFLYYSLLGSRSMVKGLAVGAAQQNLSGESIKRMRLPFPPLLEQRRIAHILGTLDDKIELNRRVNETLEAMARALFKSWFVDFDPVRAKAEGRDPGLPPHLADLFPSRLVDSELGEIPEGWEVKTIGGIAEKVAMGPFGSSIKVETFGSEGVPVISGQHLRGLVLEDSTFNFITPEHAARLESAIVRRGDVVLTHAGSIGQASLIPETSRFERYVISQRQFYMRCDRTRVSPAFMSMYFSTNEGQHRLLANTSSSGVPSIARPVTYTRSIPLVLPPRTVIGAFDSLSSPWLERVRNSRNENLCLAEYRQTVLPRLLGDER